MLGGEGGSFSSPRKPTFPAPRFLPFPVLSVVWGRATVFLNVASRRLDLWGGPPVPSPRMGLHRTLRQGFVTWIFTRLRHLFAAEDVGLVYNTLVVGAGRSRHRDIALVLSFRSRQDPAEGQSHEISLLPSTKTLMLEPLSTSCLASVSTKWGNSGFCCGI